MSKPFKLKSNLGAAVLFFDQINRDVEPEVSTDMKKVVEKILKLAKSLCPVRTGALRASGRIHTIKAPKSAFVTYRVIFGSSTVGYAHYQEVGTSRHGGRWYVTRAMRKYKHELPTAAKGSVKGVWNSHSRKFNATALI